MCNAAIADGLSAHSATLCRVPANPPLPDEGPEYEERIRGTRHSGGASDFDTGTRADLINTTPLQVISISLMDANKNEYLLNPSSTNHTGGGDAQITKNGNTFKMVGHIALYMNAQQQIQTDATPVPFEFDVTCPQIIGS
jgi:hypothetical protein